MVATDSKPRCNASLPRKRPRVIAHRGARREAPENTLPAFRRALDLGAGGVEFDVQLTSDKVPIVTHDDDLMVRTHCFGHLHLTPYRTVRALDAGSNFSKAFAGTPMPTLQETLELLAPHDILVNVEIKAQPGFIAEAVRIVGGIVGEFRMRGPVIISSLHILVVHELARRHPTLRRAYIFDSPFPFLPIALFARYEHLAALHPYVRALWPWVVRRMQRWGFEVNAWTINEPRDIDRCVALGLDGIITDDVAAARIHLDRVFNTQV